jgi:hypothetical protein
MFYNKKKCAPEKRNNDISFYQFNRRHSIKKQKKTTSKKIKTTLHEEPNHISLFIPSFAKLTTK